MSPSRLLSFFLSAVALSSTVLVVACGSEGDEKEEPQTSFDPSTPGPEAPKPAGKKVVWIDKNVANCDGGHTTTSTPHVEDDDTPEQGGGTSSGDPNVK